MRLEGKLALITGGAGGIGKAVALRFLRRGASVVLWDLDPAALEAARGELSRAGRVFAYALDLADRRGVAETAQRVRREAGEVDILDNNAGVVFGGGFLEACEEGLDKTVEVNLKAVMWCTRAFLPGMIRRGSGHIVMMASAAGLLGVPGMAAYSATKHAVIGLGESLRLELLKAGHRGIGLTIVCPSFVATGMFEGVRPPRLAPWLSPDEMADSILEAVLRERLYVREPFLIKLVPALKGLLSPGLFDRLGSLLGMHEAMKWFRGRTPGA